MKKQTWLSWLATHVLVSVAGVISVPAALMAAPPDEKEAVSEEPIKAVPKRDDWMLDFGDQHTNDKRFGGQLQGSATAPVAVPLAAPAPAPAPSVAAAAASVSRAGFAVGGAKDIGNFRENIERGYVPLPEAITVEGLYYDYVFDAGVSTTCDKLFCPTYSVASSPDPLSGKLEHFLSVGLTSGADPGALKRKKLNVVVVLDISGSMRSPFDRYHYDASHRELLDDEDRQKTKMHIAREAVQDLTRQLRNDDRFGMVVFDDNAYVAKPLNPVGETDMDLIRRHIGRLESRGGTNFEAGYKKGTELFASFRNANSMEYENRIIFLTDAMPNTGQIAEEGLFGMAENNARRGVHTTFVGVGVDFNATLIDTITKVRGANYYTVNSSKAFRKLLADDFEYMVTPLVFNLSLKIEGDGVVIDKVFGSPEADLATGEVMRVNTLFPARATEEGIKGGLVLLKLRNDPRGRKIRIQASYEKRDGSREDNIQQMQWPRSDVESSGAIYPNASVRKGILLARYANLLGNWAREERSLAIAHAAEGGRGQGKVSATHRAYCALSDMRRLGICNLPAAPVAASRWEQTSLALRSNQKSKASFKTFFDHFETEALAVGDRALSQEKQLLERIMRAN